MITLGLVYVQNNLPLTYSNPDSILRGHTFKFTQPATRVDCRLQILILPLDHQFVEHYPHQWLEQKLLMNLRTMLLLYIILIFECCLCIIIIIVEPGLANSKKKKFASSSSVIARWITSQFTPTALGSIPCR